MASPVLPGVLALALASCTATPQEDLVARAANEAALAEGWPAGASVVIVADAQVQAAESFEEVFAAPGDAPTRFVFRPGEEGDRSFTVAYLPQGGVVAGDAFLAALGAEVQSDARGALSLVRDARRVAVAADRTVPVVLTPPDGTGALPQDVRVTLDLQARGALLLPRALAYRLGAARFAIPGTTYVDVALGRPFTAHRARLRAEVLGLDAAELVEVLYPAPPEATP